MNVAIFGATGFLGKQLISRLLTQTDWNITAIGRTPEKLSAFTGRSPRLTIKKGDVTNKNSIIECLQGIDVAYYFVHMMGHNVEDFYTAELFAAETFKEAASHSRLQRIVFMGGLGDTKNSHSKHLRSRHETGEILRRATCSVIELRASMIIGEGSVAYDIIRNVATKLPIMALPASARTLTQPITASDAISYLVAAATVPIRENSAIDIGGPEVMSYESVYRRYTNFLGKRPIVLSLPYIPHFMNVLFLNIMTPPVHARIGASMAESMTTPMIVKNQLAQKFFLNIIPEPIEHAFTR